MSQYHKRIINLTYRDEDLPTFSTQEEIDAWHAAVGRMVLYGMRKEAPEDTIQMVSMGLTSKPAELCASYHSTLPACAEKYGDGHARYIGSTAELVTNAESELHNRSQAAGRSFVMAAVLHSDGKWGFHS